MGPHDVRLSVMSPYLIHGIWLPVSGLGLWIEQVEGHKILTPSAVPAGTFPEAVERILENKSFRNRARMSLRTPKGKEVSLMVPMAMFGPHEMVKVLHSLAPLDDRMPGVTAQQRAAVAPDLLWLLRVYRGLRSFVRAGRVTIRLHYDGGEWFPMWQLASGLNERGWLAEMIAAAPGIITVNNNSLSEDLADELTHWITFMELKELQTAMRPYPWHDFAHAVLHTSPVTRGRTQLLRALNDWRESITQVDLQLVIIVEEPPKDDPAEADEDSLADAPVWPVRVQVRSGTDAPRPIRDGQLDRSSMVRLRESQRAAISQSPKLDPLRPGQQEAAAAYCAGSVTGVSRVGDWDVYLTTNELVEFVGVDVARLKNAGFTVLLPKSWAHMETKARLVTSEVPHDPADAATKTHLGLDKLVAYDWRVSVGDVELNDEEMRELVESKSGLIRLRGEWVMADTSALARISEYREELAATSRKRAKKDLDAAMRQALRAKEAGEPGWELMLAEVERDLAEYNARLKEGESDWGKVTLAELRELALEAMAREPIEFTGTTWHSSLLGGMDTISPERVDIPDTVHAELREYQRRGVDWLYWMSRNNIGAVLADDMGLGKTLQLLALLAVEKDARAKAGEETPGPTLVVAPTSVVDNWAREAARFVPSFSVLVHHGTERLRNDDFVEAAKSTDVVVTSYGTAGRDFLTLGLVDWERVVLDEAQAIKNSATQASKAVRSLPSRHRVALTGTPVENRLSEMRSILDFCNPGVLGSASFFRNHFAKAIERQDDKEMAERLRQLIAPFILRRLKTDPNIIDDLPEKSEHIITVPMTAEQAALYKALVNDVNRRLESAEGMAKRGLVLSSLTHIKQICNHPAHYLGDGSPVTLKGEHRSGKVAELMRIVDKATEAGERVLVFTQYKAFGDILQPYLSNQLGTKIPFLHGGVPKNRRDQMVQDFQSDTGAPLMILSLKAGGTGLNLTAANIVIHMDRWWNPAVENQATDRAFRIGQDRNVRVYKMITAGTLEESIQEILEGKMELAGAVVGEGEGWLTELTPDQLADLMSYRGREA